MSVRLSVLSRLCQTFSSFTAASSKRLEKGDQSNSNYFSLVHGIDYRTCSIVIKLPKEMTQPLVKGLLIMCAWEQKGEGILG